MSRISLSREKSGSVAKHSQLTCSGGSAVPCTRVLARSPLTWCSIAACWPPELGHICWVRRTFAQSDDPCHRRARPRPLPSRCGCVHGVTGTGPAVEGAQISDPLHDRAIGGGGAGLLDEQGAGCCLDSVPAARRPRRLRGTGWPAMVRDSQTACNW